jgi:hypothetical protein
MIAKSAVLASLIDQISGIIRLLPNRAERWTRNQHFNSGSRHISMTCRSACRRERIGLFFMSSSVYQTFARRSRRQMAKAKASDISTGATVLPIILR